MTTVPRIHAVYHIRSDASSVEARARAIALEQSVEMPLTAIDDDFVRAEIVGRLEAVADLGDGSFVARISLSAETVGGDAGQLINMLFGNTSLHDDVVLHDVELPQNLAKEFGGPRHGLAGLRRRVQAGERALTCAALKPQGLPAAKLAELAEKFARGGIDYVKDDHGLADQAHAPFVARVAAVTAALRAVEPSSGRSARYVPSLSGDLDRMRGQIAIARDAGVDTVMIAPMIAGLANFHALVRQHPDIAFIAHPTLSGAARIAPPLLLGKLFRLLGADAFIFPHHGGRFGYSLDTCRSLARAGVADWHGLLPSVPVPAGGMRRERVAEMLDLYGSRAMLLIGGALIDTRERLVEETSAFVATVHLHSYMMPS